MILLSSPLKNDPLETTVSIFFFEIEIFTTKIVNSKSLKKTVVSFCRQWTSLRLMTSRIFLFVFLRDQNSQHFNEDLLAVNASAFSFVLCFKVIDCEGASNYALIANWIALENFWWNCSPIRNTGNVLGNNRMFSQETITDVHWYLDCLNFNNCLVWNSNETHLSTLKFFRSNCLFVNSKPQTNTADKKVVLL